MVLFHFSTLKLVIAFCCILVVAGLCLAFLFPRKVQLSVADASSAAYSESEKRVVINITVYKCCYLSWHC